MRVYATPAEYATYTGQAATADTARQLQRASQMLDSTVFRFCYYVADAGTGMPTDPTVLAAFRDATCAQVEWWTAVGDSIGIGGIGTWDQVKIGTAELRGPSGGEAGGGSAARRIAPSALDALTSPDLTPDILRVGMVTW